MCTKNVHKKFTNEEQYIREFCFMKMLNLSSLGGKYFTLYGKNLLTIWSKNSRFKKFSVSVTLSHVLRVEDVAHNEIWS